MVEPCLKQLEISSLKMLVPLEFWVLIGFNVHFLLAHMNGLLLQLTHISFLF